MMPQRRVTALKWVLSIRFVYVAGTGTPLVVGCVGPVREPAFLTQNSGFPRHTLVSIAWNETARQLVSKHRTGPPLASRVFALLSVGQYHAVVLAHEKIQQDQAAGSAIDVHLVESATIERASTMILAYLYPNDTDFLEASLLRDTRSWSSARRGRASTSAGEALGRLAAEAVLRRAKNDGWDRIWAGMIPKGAGHWRSSRGPNEAPLYPTWGNVTPWLMDSGSQFRAPPPPGIGSPEFQSALNEVRSLARSRTAEQLRIAQFWADGPGTVTPAGHWNQIASMLIVQYRMDESHAVHALSLMNMAIMDAGIACWETKYNYWLARPSHIDSTITTPIGLPSFPSYTSGHASFSGAASMVLGYIFPAELDRLSAMAEQAAMSRVDAGIHYRFDSEEGLEQGREVAGLAIALDRRRTWLLPGHTAPRGADRR